MLRSLVDWISQAFGIPGLAWLLGIVRRKFLGYVHYGHFVFLSEADSGGDPAAGGAPCVDVKMSPGALWRLSKELPRLISTGGGAGVSDHGIAEYGRKLLAYARWRNA